MGFVVVVVVGAQDPTQAQFAFRQQRGQYWQVATARVNQNRFMGILIGQ